MSFEGVYQYLCECKSNIIEVDVYDNYKPEVCHCGGRFTSYRLIDHTNSLEEVVEGVWREIRENT